GAPLAERRLWRGRRRRPEDRAAAGRPAGRRRLAAARRRELARAGGAAGRAASVRLRRRGRVRHHRPLGQELPHGAVLEPGAPADLPRVWRRPLRRDAERRRGVRDGVRPHRHRRRRGQADHHRRQEQPDPGRAQGLRLPDGAAALGRVQERVAGQPAGAPARHRGRRRPDRHRHHHRGRRLLSHPGREVPGPLGGAGRQWDRRRSGPPLRSGRDRDRARVPRARSRAAAAGEKPDFAPLVAKWGGVSLVYRKSMADSPAYRLNHEEITKFFEEGVRFVEQLSPVACIPDEHGALKAVEFERTGGGEKVTLPARSLFVAAGTSPNVTYERERPGSFEIDVKAKAFKSHRAVVKEDGTIALEPVERGQVGFFTSYLRDNRAVSYYGDNHPIYAGSVVRAMASAKDGAPHVEVLLRAPAAARHFEPGQFFRLQNFEALAPQVGKKGPRLVMEGLALTGAW